MYKANIRVTLRPSILDPQGKAVHHALQNLGHTAVEQVRMGKHVQLWIDVDEREEAERHARAACEKLLANPVMEDFTVELEKVDEADVKKAESAAA